MKKVLLLLMGLIALGCSKTEESLPEITVSKSSFDIKVRGHESFKVTISDNTWQITEVKVEDKKIADIGRGDGIYYHLTGLVKGTTNLLITASNSQKTINKSIPIVVSDIEAKEFSIPRELSINVGENRYVQYAVVPTGTTEKITWTTSDESVALIDNGRLTGVKSGTCTITATIGGLKATCNVTVKDIEVKVVKLVDFPKKWYEYKNGDELRKIEESYEYKNIDLYENQNIPLTLSFEPQNAKNKEITWTSSNAEHAEVKDGVLIAKKPIESEVVIKGTLANGKFLELKVRSIKTLDDYLVSNIKLSVGTTYSFGNVATKKLTCFFYNETGFDIKVHSMEIINAVTNTSLITIDYKDDPYAKEIGYSTKQLPISNELILIYRWKFSYNDKIFYKEARSDQDQ